MTRTGIVAGLLTCLALSLLGCSGSAASPIASSSVPPKDLPQCAAVYKAGAEVTDTKFGVACVKNDQVVSPRPVKLECTDGRQLRYNDLAWGYISEKMTLIPDDDPSKVPTNAVNECLAPGPNGRSVANNAANDGND